MLDKLGKQTKSAITNRLSEAISPTVLLPPSWLWETMLLQLKGVVLNPDSSPIFVQSLRGLGKSRDRRKLPPAGSDDRTCRSVWMIRHRTLPNKKVACGFMAHDFLAIAGEDAALITYSWQGSIGLEGQIAKISEWLLFGPVRCAISRLGTLIEHDWPIDQERFCFRSRVESSPQTWILK